MIKRQLPTLLAHKHTRAISFFYTSIFLSKRPARRSESGSTSISLAVAITKTLESFTSSMLDCIATYSGALGWLLSSFANLSKSSRNTMQGAFDLASSKVFDILSTKLASPLLLRRVNALRPLSSIKHFSSKV